MKSVATNVRSTVATPWCMGNRSKTWKICVSLLVIGMCIRFLEDVYVVRNNITTAEQTTETKVTTALDANNNDFDDAQKRYPQLQHSFMASGLNQYYDLHEQLYNYHNLQKRIYSRNSTETRKETAKKLCRPLSQLQGDNSTMKFFDMKSLLFQNDSAMLIPPSDIISPTNNDTPPISSNVEDIFFQRFIAEELWSRQLGNIYMQHSRKAGGTTLCMTLRLNRHGLIHQENSEWDMSHYNRQTCQLLEFCNDCNLEPQYEAYKNNKKSTEEENKDKPLFQGWKTYPQVLSCVLDLYERNFYESEGTVSPPDLASNNGWYNYVFISSIRHPIKRIISSLRNDPISYNPNIANCTEKPRKTDELTPCAHKLIISDEVIEARCRNGGIYHCMSNYYIRMYSGDYKGVVTRKTMDIAKRNLLRYSCVVIQEEWDTTIECLRDRLHLSLQSHGAFNMNGAMDRFATKTNDDTVQQDETNVSAATTDRYTTLGDSSTMRTTPDFNATLLKSITKVEMERLFQLNALDIEFYHWVKERVMEQSKFNWDRRLL